MGACGWCGGAVRGACGDEESASFSQYTEMAAEQTNEVQDIITAAVDKYLTSENFEVRCRGDER